MDQAPLLGRCKDCDFALFATRDNVIDVDNFKGVKESGRAYRVGNSGHFARCDQRHRVFVLKSIKGTYSPDHKCDSRCLNAKGCNCTCSCGGANHGAGHVVTTHVAITDPVRVGGYVGEVGKFARGSATLTDKRDLSNGGTLYVFTTSGGDIIKWFAPAFLNVPDRYEVGQEIAFRARVKAHEAHERFGKSTVVTYLEEV